MGGGGFGRKKDVINLDSLPLIDPSKGTPTVQAGQGFSIPLSPQEQEEQKKEREKMMARQGMTMPSEGGAKKPEETSFGCSP